MKVNKISILGGVGKDSKPEKVERLDLYMGDVISIVGPTGCGKTTLINDIELFANSNTPSKRTILIDDLPIDSEYSYDPSQHPIAMISQHTNFLSDLPVSEFLTIHATIRGGGNIEALVNETVDFANQLTGEQIIRTSAMTELSGGQTRSLLIADAVIIGHSPVILLDEIENAGIHRTKALSLLKNYNKIFVFVTHDPRIALLSDYRVVMKNGAMQRIIVTNRDEKMAAVGLKKIDDVMLECRRLIRAGDEISDSVFTNLLTDMIAGCEEYLNTKAK